MSETRHIQLQEFQEWYQSQGLSWSHTFCGYPLPTVCPYFGVLISPSVMKGIVFVRNPLYCTDHRSTEEPSFQGLLGSKLARCKQFQPLCSLQCSKAGGVQIQFSSFFGSHFPWISKDRHLQCLSLPCSGDDAGELLQATLLPTRKEVQTLGQFQC